MRLVWNRRAALLPISVSPPPVHGRFNKRDTHAQLGPGGDNNLAVILSTYEPQIRCSPGTPFRNAPSCNGLLADMPASREKILWGPGSTPGVQEVLPQLILAGKFLPWYLVPVIYLIRDRERRQQVHAQTFLHR